MSQPGRLTLLFVPLVLACNKGGTPTSAPVHSETAPDPLRAQCEKLTDLVLERAPSDGNRNEMVEECTSSRTKEREEDPETFAEISTCIDRATTLEEFLLCSVAATESDERAEVRALCEQLLVLVEADPDIPPLVKAEAADIHMCMEDAWKEKAEDPERFARTAACIRNGTTMTEAVSCMVATKSPSDAPPAPAETSDRIEER